MYISDKNLQAKQVISVYFRELQAKTVSLNLHISANNYKLKYNYSFLIGSISDNYDSNNFH